MTGISARYDASDLGGPFKWQRVGVASVIEVGPHSVRRMICQSTQPSDAALDLSIVLVDAASSFGTGQLKWQNDRTGRVSWQRADLRVTGHRSTTLGPNLAAFGRVLST